MNFQNQAAYTISGTCDTEDAAISFSSSSQPLGSAVCNGTGFTKDVNLQSFADGDLAVSLTITDDHGNSSSQDLNLTKDTVAPTLSHVSGENSNRVNFQNQAAYTISGTCDTEDASISFSSNSQSLGSAVCNGTGFTKDVDLQAFADGDLVVSLTITDDHGNFSSLDLNLTKDTIAPTLSNVSGENGNKVNSQNQAAYTISGTCDTQDASISIFLAFQNLGSAICDGTSFTKDVDLQAFADGDLAVSLTITDDYGNAGSLSLSLTKDTVAPTLSHVSGENNNKVNFQNQAAYNISGTCDTEDASISFSSGSESLGSAICDGTSFTKDLNLQSFADGDLAVSLTITDDHGNFNSLNLNLTKDTVAPTLSNVSGENSNKVNLANQAAYTVSGTCDTEDASISFSLGSESLGSAVCDGTNFTKDVDLQSFADGDLVVSLIITDAHGNAGSLNLNLTKDTVAPRLSNVSGENGNKVNLSNQAAYTLSGDCDTENAVISLSFNFQALGSAVCDGTSFTKDVDLQSFADGDLVVSLMITDDHGNFSSLSLHLTKDTMAPTLSNVSGENGNRVNLANQAAYTISGTCDTEDASLSFSSGSESLGSAVCNGTGFTKDVNLQSFADGDLTVSLTITDDHGNFSSLSLSLTKDTVAPILSSVSGENSNRVNLANQAAYTISGTCDTEDTTISFSSGFQSLGSAICNGTSFTKDVDLQMFSQGSLVVLLTITDDHGNFNSLNLNLMKDTMAPILSNVSGENGNRVNLANQAAYTISGTCDTQDAAISFSSGSQSLGSAVCNGTGFTKDVNLQSFADGALVVSLTITDDHGNFSSFNLHLMKNMIVPMLSNVSGENGNRVNFQNQAAYAISGDCDTEDASISFSASSQDLGSAVCNGTSFTKNVNLQAFSQGSLTVSLTITDALGNTSSQDLNLTKDTVAPTLSNVAGENGNKINISNQQSYTVSGNCNEAGRNVNLSVGALSQNAVCSGTNFSAELNFQTNPNPLLNSIDDGPLTLTATLTDEAGNIASVSLALTKDTVAPSLSSVSGENSNKVNSQNQAGYTLSGNCDDSTATISFSHGADALGNVACNGTGFTKDVDLQSLSDSLISLTVIIRDPHGNSTAQTLALTKDTTGPTLSDLQGENGNKVNLQNQSSYTVSGDCDDNASTISFSSGSTGLGSTTCSGNSLQWDLDLQDFEDGSITLTLLASDPSGNSSTYSLSLTKDTVAPTLSNVSGENNNYINFINQGSYTVSGDCDMEDAVISFSSNSQALSSAVCDGTNFTKELGLQALNEGALVVSLVISDDHGSTSSLDLNLTKDTVIPTISSIAGENNNIMNYGNVNSYTISGECTENDSSIELSTGSITATTVCSSLSFSGDMDLSSFVNQNITVTAVVSDAAGNSSQTSLNLSSNFQSFVSLWEVSSDNLQVTLPLNAGSRYNFNVDWGDGTVANGITLFNDPRRRHTYAQSGDYTITITGLFERFGNFSDFGFRTQLKEITNLGSVGWKTLAYSFQATENLTSIQGGDVSLVTDMSGAFFDSSITTIGAENWDVSNVTSMLRMFRGADIETIDVSDWDVSNVTNMEEMFYEAENVNPDVSEWDVSRVTNMAGLFERTTVANPDVSLWDVSGVTNMRGVFDGAQAANPDVSLWDVSRVTSMSRLFASTKVANPDVSNWDVSRVTSMFSMFSSSDAANPDVSGWDVSRVTDMSRMFSSADSANPDMISWTFNNSVNLERLLSYSGINRDNYSALLIKLSNEVSNFNSAQNLYQTPSNNGSAEAMAALQTLLDEGWIIFEASPPLRSITHDGVINVQNQSTYTLSGRCAEGESVVTFSHLDSQIGSAVCSTPDSRSRFTVDLDLSSLSDGAVTFVLDYNDSLGSYTTNVALTKDTTVPTLSNLSGENNNVIISSNETSYTVSGDCDTQDASISFAVNSNVISTTTCASGSFQHNLDLQSLSDGALSMVVTIESASGNSSSSTLSLTKDSTAPILSSVSGLNNNKVNLQNQSSYVLSGDCDDSEGTVKVFIDSSELSSSSCGGGNFQFTLNLQSYSDGALSVTLTTEDTHGNSSSSILSLTKDTVAPALSSVSGLNNNKINFQNQNSYVVLGSCDDSTAIVKFFRNSSELSSAICNGSSFQATLNLQGPSDGAVTVTLTIEDTHRNSSSVSLSLSKDASRPTLSGLSGENNNVIISSNETSYTVSGSCDDNSADISFSVNSNVLSTTTCASGSFQHNLDLQSLSDGVLAMTVTIEDSHGNLSSSILPLTKDTTAPVLSSLSGVNNNKVNSQNQNSYAVSGSCDDSAATVKVLINSLELDSSVCTGGNFQFTLDLQNSSDGALTLTFTAEDIHLNSSSSTLSLTKDTVGPVLSSLSGVNNNKINSQNQNSYAVSGSCDDSTATVKVLINSLELDSSVCTGGNFQFTLDLQNSSDGALTLTFTAEDTQLNSSSSTLSLTKDTVAPVLSSVSGVNSHKVNVQNQSSYVVSGSCDDNTATVKAFISSTQLASSSCSSGSFQMALNLQAFSDGAMTVNLTIEDTHLNSSSVSLSLSKDTSIPTLSGLSGENSNVITTFNEESYTVSGSCDDNSADISFSVNSNVLSTTTCASGSFQHSLDLQAFSDGALSMAVTIEDTHGNSSSSTLSLTKDATAPVLSSLGGLNNDNVNLQNQSAYTVSGNCDDSAATVKVLINSSELDSSVCTGGSFQFTLNLQSYSDGTVTVTFTAEDTHLNLSSMTLSLTKDTSIPRLSNLSGENSNTVNVFNRDSYTISGDCSENVVTVTAFIDSSPLESSSCSDSSFQMSLALQSYSDGDLTVTFTAEDSVGNSSSSSLSLLKETVVPLTSSVSGENSNKINISNQTSYTVSGNCDDNTASLSFYRPSDELVGTASCTAGQFTQELDFEMSEDGTFALTVRIEDPAGNASSNIISLSKDTVAPSVSGLSGENNNVVTYVNYRSYTFSGNCSDIGGTVGVLVYNQFSYTTTCSSSGDFSVETDFSSVSNLQYIPIQATVSDDFGNSFTGILNVSKDVHPFESQWRLTSENLRVELPLKAGYTYDFYVDWGDGNTGRVTSHNDLDRIHDYSSSGDYDVTIDGVFEAFGSSSPDATYKGQLRRIDQLGTMEWKNLSHAFSHMSPALQFLRAIDVSQVTDMSFMLQSSTVALGTNMRYWDVSSVTNMEGLFLSSTLNPNLSEWTFNANVDLTNFISLSNITDDNYSDLLINLASQAETITPQTLASPVTDNSSQEAIDARNTLASYGWIFVIVLP